MKKITLLMATIALIASCKKKENKPVATTAVVTDSAVFKDSVTGHLGKVLKMTFDNNAHTAQLLFEGETINLKQDTTASGIKYSNTNYIYNEWHGEITLKKGNEIVFSNQ